MLYTVKGKGGKPDRKPYPLPYGLRNLQRNLKSENSQNYAQKPQRNFKFINSASAFSVRIHGARPRAVALRLNAKSELTDSLQTHSWQTQRTGTQTEAKNRRKAQWKQSTQMHSKERHSIREEHRRTSLRGTAHRCKVHCTDTHRRAEHWTHS